MVPRENKSSAYAKFGGTNKEYYSIFRNGLLMSLIINTRFRFLMLLRVVTNTGEGVC